MPLPVPPDRLIKALAGRYRIERELGQGGMATVYLAEDLKHKRNVALKVLKPELAAVLGAERFVVEITTTAALQHPHILPLFDSGEADGFLFYVMPFIDGETLRSKLDRETQLGIDEAVRIAVDVASALHYAHEHGVIHRDIKPENILLHDGRPMVADFGIALALSAAAGGRMTETGLSLGTPHYMSPEQATAAKEITARSDVYSLGSVLYEMLAGNPPHTGATAQAIIMKIIAESADAVVHHRKSVPPNVAAAVARAIEKVPADRFATAKEFADALGNPSYTTAVYAHGKGGRAAGWRDRAVVPLAMVAGLLLVTAAWGWLRPSPERAVARLAITLPDSAPLQIQPGNIFALSEDGAEIVYTGPGGGDVDLWVRRLNELTATRVPDTNGADAPFLSRDGEVVAFYRATPAALYTVTLRGGPRQTLVSDSTLALGGDFGPDGSVYFVRSDGLRRVGASGGAVEEVTRVDTSAGERRHGWIDVLPDGKGAIFTILRGSEEQADIAAVDLESHKVTILVRATYARYAETGHLVYANADGGLFAIAFDAGTLTTSGTAIPIVAGVARGPDGIAHFAVSRTGTLLYGGGGVGGAAELVWVDRQGRVERIDSTLTGPFAGVALSPNGRTLAFTQGPGGMTTYNVWTKDLAAGTVQNLTIRGASYGASWSPDGRSLSYVEASATGRDLYLRRADGSGNQTLVHHAERAVEYGFVSPDGQWIIYQAVADGGASSRDIFARRMSGDTATVELAASDRDERAPRLSPDGRWIALVAATNAPGRPDVFVSPFPEAGSSRVQVSIAGGRDPIWSSNGRELFYETVPGNDLVSARVELSPTFRVLERTTLFSLSGFTLARIAGDRTFDVTPDGRKFVMMRSRGDANEQLVLVLNWFDELKAMGRR